MAADHGSCCDVVHAWCIASCKRKSIGAVCGNNDPVLCVGCIRCPPQASASFASDSGCVCCSSLGYSRPAARKPPRVSARYKVVDVRVYRGHVDSLAVITAHNRHWTCDRVHRRIGATFVFDKPCPSIESPAKMNSTP